MKYEVAAAQEAEQNPRGGGLSKMTTLRPKTYREGELAHAYMHKQARGPGWLAQINMRKEKIRRYES